MGGLVAAALRSTADPAGVVALGPGPSGTTMAIDSMPDKESRIISRRIEGQFANMQRTVEGVKRIVDARKEA